MAIKIFQVAQFNLVGDGVSDEVEIDLDDITLSIPIPANQVIVGIGTANIAGPSPVPEITTSVVDGKAHKISLKFSTPLVEFTGGNGYTIFVSILLEPEIK